MKKPKVLKRLGARNFGPIHQADVRFGDLTVLVGRQATGKSLFLQLYKAMQDPGDIRSNLKGYGFDWSQAESAAAAYSELYFGGGFQDIVTPFTLLRYNGRPIEYGTIVKPSVACSTAPTVYFIPAHRMLVLQDGWPPPFMTYPAGTPFCVRLYSDYLWNDLRDPVVQGLALSLYPARLAAVLKELVDDEIHPGAKLRIEVAGMRRSLVVAPDGGGPSLPYHAWSGGQRQLTPLLLSLSYLLPSGRTPRAGNFDTVIIEEPELGLHPQSIVRVGLLLLELLQREYRVIVSTHSPVLLDLVWAIRHLRSTDEGIALAALSEIFGVRRLSTPLKRTFQAALSKQLRTYCFKRTAAGAVTKDISSLDPGDDDDDVSGWGGLSGVSGKIADIVSRAIVMIGSRRAYADFAKPVGTKAGSW